MTTMNSHLNIEIARLRSAEIAERAATHRPIGSSPLDFAPVVAPVLAVIVALVLGAPISP